MKPEALQEFAAGLCSKQRICQAADPDTVLLYAEFHIVGEPPFSAVRRC